MAHLVEDIAKYFQFEDVVVDNWHFKLYSKGCVVLFFTGSLVGVMSQYFGEPINCDFKGLDGEAAKDYCWIHGSSYIPPEYQAHLECFTNLDGVTRPEDAPDTSYYQWVTFMQLFQAGVFMLPKKMWHSFENGLIAQFGSDARSSVLLTEDAHYDDGIIMEAVVEKYVKYFRAILHHNQLYFSQFLFCELLNFVFVFANFWATDQFLQGNFKTYGYDVIQYYTLSPSERRLHINPLCNAFPKAVSCSVPVVGPSGGRQHANAFCVLSQNVINEKMYLVIWFYMTFCCCCSIIFLFYRISTLFFDFIRFGLLYAKVRHRYDPQIKPALQFVLDKCYIGDWFVLLQLSKNVNHYFFRVFIKELSNELKRPLNRSRNDNANREKRALLANDEDNVETGDIPGVDSHRDLMFQRLENEMMHNPIKGMMHMRQMTGKGKLKQKRGKKKRIH